MQRRGNPARLVIALSIAAVLAIFLLYTSIAGGTPSLQPSQLSSHVGRVQIVGSVVGPRTGNSYRAGGLHFRMRDIGGKAIVPVVYRGDVGALFKIGQNILVTGRLRACT